MIKKFEKRTKKRKEKMGKRKNLLLSNFYELIDKFILFFCKKKKKRIEK